jgi:hypothetical protein
MARFVISEGENIVDGPSRPSARGKVEFYVVFVLIEPGIEQEGLELHASTSTRELTLLLILQFGAGMIFNYERWDSTPLIASVFLIQPDQVPRRIAKRGDMEVGAGMPKLRRHDDFPSA